MRYRRDRKPGGWYFFTVVTHKRQAILTLPGNIERLRESFRHEIARHFFVLDALVVLPDHIHCLWRLPVEDMDYSGRWNRIKRYFSTGCCSVTASVSPSREAKRECAVWQRRFWEHRIRDDEDWRRHMDYIHYNPVKHGYAASPGAWPLVHLSGVLNGVGMILMGALAVRLPWWILRQESNSKIVLGTLCFAQPTKL